MEKLLKQRVEILAQEVDKMKSGGAGEGYTKSEADAKFLSKDDASTALAGKQDSLDQTQLEAVNSGIDSTKAAQIETNKTNILSVQDMVCDDTFSTSKAYAVDDITIYDNKLYKFKNAHQGAWSASDVDQISLSEQNSELTKLESEDRAALAVQVDEGAKNLLDWKNTAYYLYTGANPQSTYTKTDTSVTVTSTGAYAYAAFNMPELQPGNYVLSCRISNPTIASDIIAISIQLSPFAGVRYSGNSVLVVKFTVPRANVSKLLFYANLSGDNVSNTVTFSDIMICTETDWKISQNFSDYALPNYDLTAAIIEQVDGGAKNHVNYNNTLKLSGSSTVIEANSDTSFTIIDTTTGSTRFYYIPFTVKEGDYIVSGCPLVGTDATYRVEVRDQALTQIIPNSSDYGLGSDIMHLAAGTYCVVIRLDSTYATPATGIIFYPMICTIADWNVSKAYQPYRPSYQELYEMVLALQTTRTATTRKTTKTKTNEE